MGKISKLALATAAMVAAGVSVTNNPSAEDVNSQIEKRAGISQTTSQNRTMNNNQQTKRAEEQRSQQTGANYVLSKSYTPSRGYYTESMTPKEYGQYIMAKGIYWRNLYQRKRLGLKK